jgi:hypothetical protein
MADVVVVKGKAGLGNRMLAAVTGLLYAPIAGRRLVVDWSDFTYSNDGTNAFPDLFAAPSVSEKALLAGAEVSIRPSVWNGRLHQSANDLIDEFAPADHKINNAWKKYSFDLTRMDHPEDVLVFWSFTHQIPLLRRHFTGQWAHLARMSDDQILSKVFREDLRPSTAIMKKVHAFKREHFDGEVIGVHVRYMDRKTSIRDFLKHLDRKVARRPGAMIFLATDNKEAEATIRGRYRRVVTTPKWFPESGVSMHQNHECPDRLNNAVEALLDMYLLAECDHLIFPGSSTFSWIASLATSMPPENIVDIEKYNLRIQTKKFIKKFI